MTTGNESGAVICSDPIDAAVLADYWLARWQIQRNKPLRSICMAATHVERGSAT